MTTRIVSVGAAVLTVAAMACVRAGGDDPTPSRNQPAASKPQGKKVVKSNTEWRRQLSPEEFYVTRQKGTEPAFSGRYWNHHGDGIYRCVCCETPLFDSRTKFESGTGWPSFFAAIGSSAVRTANDVSQGMVRTEVLCRICDAHLGHVFKDGPRPTGLRFCMNSASLRFQSRAEIEAEAAARAILESSPELAPGADADADADAGPEPAAEGGDPGPKPDEPAG